MKNVWILRNNYPVGSFVKSKYTNVKYEVFKRVFSYVVRSDGIINIQLCVETKDELGRTAYLTSGSIEKV